MDERDQKTNGTFPPEEEERVRRLLQMAGPRPPIPQEDLAAISQAARSAWRQQVRPGTALPERTGHRPFRTLALGLAATLALAVGLAWWLKSRTDRVPPSVAWVEAVAGPVYLEVKSNAPRMIAEGEAVPLEAALRTGDGQRRSGRASLRLATGATLRIDVETRLRFVSAAALELERGALYVDTGRGPRAAIEVRTPVGTVRDVGTQFAVRVVGPGKPTLVVRVRDGAVLTEHRGRRFSTPAGEELVLRRDGTAEHRQVAPHGSAWEWVLAASPGFDVEGHSLQEFLDWVRRETGWRIRFADKGLAESAAKIVLHGSIGGLRADRAPFAVLPGAGLDGEVQDGELVVRRR